MKEIKSIKQEIKKYRSEVNIKHLQRIFNNLYDFYDDKQYPFENLGILKETQLKFKYDPVEKAIFIAVECSANNRVPETKPKWFNMDWFTNLFFIPSKALKNGNPMRTYEDSLINFYTHTGFTVSFKAIEEDLKKRLEEFITNNEVENIYCYGWSLGGALVQLIHESLVYRYNIKEDRNIQILSFASGSPRVFYYAFKYNPFKALDWFRLSLRFKKCFLLKDVNDIITRVPPVIFGARHVIQEVRLGGKFNIIEIFKVSKHHMNTNYRDLFNKLDK